MTIVTKKPALTLAAAERMISACLSAATARQLSVAVAVVDDGGHSILQSRMDGVPAGAPDIVMGKARTAALFGMETKVLEDFAMARPTFLSTGATLLEGGVPVIQDGCVVGAIGVGGATPAEDAVLARESIAALSVRQDLSS
jgi:glc operon protein GlcG